MESRVFEEWTSMHTSQSGIIDGTSEQSGKATNSEGVLKLHPRIMPNYSEEETFQDTVQLKRWLQD